MINHHNFDYAAGPTFPEAVGDRYYAQDLARDYHAKIDDAGRKAASGFDGFPVLTKDSNVKKGTTFQKIDIPIARGIVEFEVDVPTSYESLPPTVSQENIYCRIETTAQTDLDISGTATLNGVATNYVKVTYNETNGASRNRAKKAGSYVYEKAVSFTITVDTTAPTNKDLVLAELVGDGATSMQITCRPRTRHFNAAYDYVVETQEDFNIIIDYTAANQYRIKDSVKSIFVKYLSGGYQMTGATSPLQEGDAYGYIKTNDCSKITFEPGTFIDTHQNIGYLEVETDYCYLENVNIQGDKGAASAITRSFLLNASYVTFVNCSSSIRLSNTDINVFERSATAIHNTTAIYRGCNVENIDSSGKVYAFYQTKNMENCFVYDIESTGDNVIAYRECNIMSNCRAIQLDSTAIVTAFYDCNNIVSCYCEDLDSSANTVYGFYLCDNLSACTVFDIASAGGTVTAYNICNHLVGCSAKQLDYTGGGAIGVSGYAQSKNMSGCIVEDIDTNGTSGANGYTGCEKISSCTAYDIQATAGPVNGFATCTEISTCIANQLDATGLCYGFSFCDQISSCKAIDIDSSGSNSDGFYSCEDMSACWATDIDSATGTNNGFESCISVAGCQATLCLNGYVSINNITGSKAFNNTLDGFESCQRVTGCVSFNNTNDGFMDCSKISGCNANSNGNDGFEDCTLISASDSNNNTGNGFDNCKNMTANRATGNTAANYLNSFADWGGTQACADTAVGGYNS